MHSKMKYAFFSLSLANLFFIKIWWELLSLNKTNDGRFYFVQNDLIPNDYWAAILNVIVLAGVIYGLMDCARNSKVTSIRCSANIIITCVAVITVFWVVRYLGLISDNSIAQIRTLLHGKLAYIVAALGLALTLTVPILAIRLRWFNYLKNLLVTLMIIFTPFCFVTFAQSVYKAMSYRQLEVSSESIIPHKIPAVSADQRVVIILFDELDYRLAFTERPPWVILPNLYRFKNNSLSATSAVSPAGYTQRSIPALLTGRMLKEEKVVSATDMLLTDYNSGHSMLLSTTPTIFSDVHQRGGISGLVGWCLPYHKIFQKDVAFSNFYNKINLSSNYPGSTLPEKMLNQYSSLIPMSISSSRIISMYSLMRKKAVELSSDPRVQLVFLHFPYPHLPHMYDLNKKIVTPMSNDPKNYFGNLALADITLGEIRTRMEQEKIWDKTLVIVTSDHWWRSSISFDAKEDHRVPFMVKLPDTSAGSTYNRKFNTVIMKEMISAYFEKEFIDNPSLTVWLDKRK